MTLIASGLVLLQGLHLVVRPGAWVIDVRWAVFSYLFSLIFFGPACAAVGAWAGRHEADVNWMAVPGTTMRRVASASSLLVICWLVLGLGLVASLVAVALAGGSMRMTGLDSLNLAIAFLACAGYYYCGAAVGAGLRGRLVPGFIFVASFALTMWGWVAGAEGVVRLGGASGGLIGIGMGFTELVIRGVFWLAVCAVGLLGLVSRLRVFASPGARQRWGYFSAASAAFLLLLSPVVPSPIRAAEIDWACDDSQGFSVCVPRGQDHLLLRTVEAFSGHSDAALIAAANAPRNTQILVDDSRLLLEISRWRDSLDPGSDVRTALALQLQTAYSPACAPDAQISEDQEQASMAVSLWLIDRTASSTTAEGLVSIAPAPEQHDEEWLASQLGVLPECPVVHK